MREPPHNNAAEMAVIGGVLMDNGAYARIQDMLAPDDFYGIANQAIWEAVLGKLAEGAVADGVTLSEHFKTSETLKQIGGKKYLSDLLDSAAFGPEIQDYAALIKDMSGRRRIGQAAQQILRGLDEHDGIEGKPVTELAAAAVDTIEKAVAKTDKRRFQKLSVAGVNAVTRAMQRGGGGISTGLQALDRKIGGLPEANLIILAARPSMGKTALALQIATNVAGQSAEDPDDPDKRRVVGLFSMEMDAGAVGVRSLSAAMYQHEGVRLPYSHMLQGWVKPHHKDALARAAEKIPFVEVDDRGEISLAYVRERAGALRKAHGRLDLLIIDYLQLMNLTYRNKQETQTDAIGRLTKGLKSLAKELGIPILALSQLSRGVEQREDKRPQLADLRDSGTIEQDADVVMFVYREHYYLERQGEPKKKSEIEDWQNRIDASEPHFDIIVAKQRQGPRGTVRQYWDGATGYIADTREDVKK